MRSVFLLLYLSLLASLSYPGFPPDTAVLGCQGFISVGQLQKVSCIPNYDLAKKTVVQGIVTNHNAYISSCTYKVVCDNEISFVASPNQRVLTNSEWCFVKDLKKGDRLNCCVSAYATVLSVEICSAEQYLCEITVEPYHTFCVTLRGIIVHNSPAIVISAVPAVIPVVAKAAGVVATVGAALYSLFAKNAGDSIDRNNINSSSNCSVPPLPPDDEEFKKKHPHGRYEDVGYHKNHQSGRKSPRPIDGQTALDNSFDIPGKERTRIGFSQGQFVVLNETVEGVYHGHVRSWVELRVVMQNILKKHGIVTQRGKFIK